MILDLGCGGSPRDGAIGVDVDPAFGSDVVHDLNTFPYPFETGSAEGVYLDNVLEHLDDVIAVMEEIHRLSADGALVTVIVPYFRSRWSAIDPTHQHQFTVDSFAYFDHGDELWRRYRYTDVEFEVESVRFNVGWPISGLRGSLVKWANRNPQRYESRVSTFLPLDELTFELRVRKPSIG